MEIVNIKTSELKEYANNPRDNDGAVESVAESIKQFGFKVPIIIDRNNTIVAGHTRKKAAERLGLASVPCVVADDLTPEQIKAFRLADNKTGELAEWDFAALEKELSELTAFDVDMSAFGFYDFEDDYFDNIFNPPTAAEVRRETPTADDKQPTDNEEAQDDTTQETGKYILTLEFDDEADARELIEFLESEDYEFSFERR